MESWGTPKITETKNGHVFYATTVKKYQYTIKRLNFVRGYSKNKLNKKRFYLIVYPFCVALK